MLNKVKLALRVTTEAFDSEITDLIAAACADLVIVGVEAVETTTDPVETTTDPLLIRAIITYCRLHFGQPDDYERLKRSYDEQKAQLISCTGYGLEA